MQKRVDLRVKTRARARPRQSASHWTLFRIMMMTHPRLEVNLKKVNSTKNIAEIAVRDILILYICSTHAHLIVHVNFACVAVRDYFIFAILSNKKRFLPLLTYAISPERNLYFKYDYTKNICLSSLSFICVGSESKTLWRQIKIEKKFPHLNAYKVTVRIRQVYL